MFDIAWSEILLISVIALIFIGPKELPQVLYSLGKLLAKVRNTADDFRRQFETSMREAGYEDLHKNFHDLRALNPARQIQQTLHSAINEPYTPPSSPAPNTPSDNSSITPSAPASGAGSPAQPSDEARAGDPHSDQAARSTLASQAEPPQDPAKPLGQAEHPLQ